MEKIKDIFQLLEQVESQEESIVNELKKEIIEFIKKGNFIEDEDSIKNYKLRKSMTIEEIYELTEGKLQYAKTKSMIRKIFYLVSAQSYARELAEILRKITKNNPNYEKIIEYIENNAFVVEPTIFPKSKNKDSKSKGSNGLSIKDNEMGLLEQIKHLTIEEQGEILEKGGISNITKRIMDNHIGSQEHFETNDSQKTKEEYYIETILDSYNWKRSGINKLGEMGRRDIVKRLQEIDCISICKKLAEAGITEKNMIIAIINLAITEQLDKILDQDVKQTRKNLKQLKQVPTIKQIEEFLGYHKSTLGKIELRDYQKIAVNQIGRIWKDKRFASVILPTGVGKSFVAISKLLEYNNKPILYLAPNNEILEQMKEYIVKYVHGKKGTLGKTK